MVSHISPYLAEIILVAVVIHVFNSTFIDFSCCQTGLFNIIDGYLGMLMEVDLEFFNNDGLML
jgi:hypothetical protein